MPAQFTDLAACRAITRRWISRLRVYAVGEGTVHQYLEGVTNAYAPISLQQCLHVPDLSPENDYGTCRLFSSRRARNANAPLKILLTSTNPRLLLSDETAIPSTAMDDSSPFVRT